MRTARIIPLAGAVLLWAPWAWAISNSGKIDSVTVYTNRASVKRVVEVEHAAGRQTLELDSLPTAMEDGSIRAGARGQAGLVIQSVDVSTRQTLGLADPKVKALADAIDVQNEKIRLLEVRREARQGQIEFLESLATARAQAAGEDLTARNPVSKPTPQELGGILDMVFEKRMIAEKDLASIEPERKKINEEIGRLQRELVQAQGGGAQSAKKIAITFDAEKPGKAAFTVEYMLPGAWWTPVYLVRGDIEKKKAAVSYGAMVGQKTGEDWTDVKLALSTAQPSAGAKAPKVEPWWVGINQPMLMAARDGGAPATVMMEMKQAKSRQPAAPAEAAADLAEDQTVEAKQAVAAVQASGTVVNFDIPQRATIVSGGDVKKVSVAEIPFESELSFTAAPAMVENVFIRASSLNTSGFPLLPGEANVFQGDSFVGKGALDMVADRQKLEVELGVDPGFKITRKLVKKETGSQGLISSKTTVKFIYETQIQSFKKNKETVEVRDRLPFSRDQRLTLEDIVLDPKPEKRDEQNIITWKMEMRPGEKRKIRMEFTMTYPSDLVPQGF